MGTNKYDSASFEEMAEQQESPVTQSEPADNTASAPATETTEKTE